MFARITPYKLKSGTVDAATARARELKDEIMALPGLIEFTNAVNADGSGYIVSLVESREISDSNAERVREIWGKMGEFLAEMPTPGGYDVVDHWET
ncbi:MAG: hypothetical protein KJO42_01910 [Silicimonas sp.]|nr:hypothetical protein [Silicimonas sp.]MBT8424976.1 hypothetical protein [Silicimonas sp.]NND17899.1 hypothetical protein [Silicimonas sp.]NNL35137.1 hypothetical protein [Silicimonas sp.]RZV99212.1 MAG: hypothetical protein EX266_15535 [Paracoccaceae bacterium]